MPDSMMIIFWDEHLVNNNACLPIKFVCGCVSYQKYSLEVKILCISFFVPKVGVAQATPKTTVGPDDGFGGSSHYPHVWFKEQNTQYFNYKSASPNY